MANGKGWAMATVEEAEKVLQDHFGDRVHVERRRTTYSPGNCTTKFQFAQVTEDGAMTKERQDFESYAGSYGLDPDDFGAEFTTFRGDTYRIIGLNTRARKYPIVAEKVGNGGGRYKFPAEQVKNALERQKQEA